MCMSAACDASARPQSGFTFTRYCHHQYCMVHGLQHGVGKRASIAQWSCNSIAIG